MTCTPKFREQPINLI
ncbi:TPA: hypothetical protein ANIA_11619 [Aspergillus nidulans FGSC A4]|uniref:Uncharacterized protein n=1 Tax=Emericella nidulans (strain FGSC A4 / ATCC 38163 / CBS 112.46 / NRRL 194 / M139) TaxID=227321 RepID=C8VEQ6_EMENI|nr:TPA: hypothetical protein ANIA_11619 [Aspergillus nidulans FGSC A4]